MEAPDAAPAPIEPILGAGADAALSGALEMVRAATDRAILDVDAAVIRLNRLLATSRMQAIVQITPLTTSRKASQ